MLVRALKLQLAGGETLVGALNALVTSKWSASMVNGQTILSISEALNTVDHRTPIPATGLYVHRLLSKFNRLQLASVARYLWDNVGLVFYANDLVANYSTPMIPRGAIPQSREPEVE